MLCLKSVSGKGNEAHALIGEAATSIRHSSVNLQEVMYITSSFVSQIYSTLAI